MKNRLHDKKAGIAILVALIIISVAEVIFRAVAMGLEAVFTTANFGEQLAVIVLAVTILTLTAKGKDRACYVCYGAWAGYFVLDKLFELPGVIAGLISPIMLPTESMFMTANVAHVARILAMCGVIAIGILLVEYINDGTICNRVFNSLCVITTLLYAVVIVMSVCGFVLGASAGAANGMDLALIQQQIILNVFNAVYCIIMVFFFTFFAYDSAKHQLKKTNLSK